MPNMAVVPDAWDDEWETQADRAAQEGLRAEPAPPRASSKADRLAQHAETNRKLWESAETPETFHFLAAGNGPPVASNFKPHVQVLSRKPVIARRDPATGLSKLVREDDGDDDDAACRAQLPSPEEIRAKQRKEREDKQRRYDEARAKIFGEPSPSAGVSSPSGAVTPPRSDGRHTPQGGRARGGRGGSARNIDPRQSDGRGPSAQPSPHRELYDPNQAPRPNGFGHRRGGDNDPSGRASAPSPQQTLRAPRGPDGSGRGGFGFTGRRGQG